MSRISVAALWALVAVGLGCSDNDGEGPAPGPPAQVSDGGTDGLGEPPPEPVPLGDSLEASAGELVFSAQAGTTARRVVTLLNRDTQPVRVSGVRVTGADGAAFSSQSAAVTLEPGASRDLEVVFSPAPGSVRTWVGSLDVLLEGAAEPVGSIGLHGLSSLGPTPGQEPTLQNALDTLGFRVTATGDTAIPAPLFAAAGSGPMRLSVVARYSAAGALDYGIYTLSGGNPVTSSLGVLADDGFQTLWTPNVLGEGNVGTPAGSAFGVWVAGQGALPAVYSQNGLNPQARAATRTFGLANRAGEPVPNAYVVAVDQDGDGDYQDVVFTLSGVRPLPLTLPMLDTTPPQVAVVADPLTGSSVAVTVVAMDTSSGVQSVAYRLDSGPFSAYEAPVTVLVRGPHTVVARAVDRAGNLTDSAPVTFEVTGTPPPVGPPNLALENLDRFPFNDRLIFNRIGSLTSPPGNGVHNRATLRLRNDAPGGSDPLLIRALPITGPWAVVNPPALPASLSPGQVLDLTVEFRATSGELWNGELRIESNDPDASLVPVQLAGFWQSVSEGGQEPFVPEIVRLAGFGTIITGPGQSLDNDGRIETVGDEILAPYWTRADPAQPVTIRQIAAFHQMPPAGFPTQLQLVEPRVGGTNGRNLGSVLTLEDNDAQSILPRIEGSAAPAQTQFIPAVARFGFVIDGYVFSDPAANYARKPEYYPGCPATACGHQIRVWPAKDRAGVTLPNTYLMVNDFSGGNYDFNDNVYVLSNVTPSP
ncbi:MAG TPA: hypothetical protein VEY30_13790 [Myxococcaceae bacterium]|nr:hypothetical protein [Myxococcaceae bacterium]